MHVIRSRFHCFLVLDALQSKLFFPMEAMFFKSQRLLKGYSINDLTSLNALKFTSCGHVSDDVIIKAERYSEMGRGG